MYDPVNSIKATKERAQFDCSVILVVSVSIVLLGRIATTGTSTYVVMYVDAACYYRWSFMVCLSLCQFVMIVSPAKNC